MSTTREQQLEAAVSKMQDEICQTLGKVMGYPWFKDDLKNFPGATESNGVCVADNTAESMADQAADTITRLTKELANAWSEHETDLALLAAALRPFVDAYKRTSWSVMSAPPSLHDDLPDDAHLNLYVLAGDCRRAERALEKP